jgi:hypothetical protein
MKPRWKRELHAKQAKKKRAADARAARKEADARESDPPEEPQGDEGFPEGDEAQAPDVAPE